MVSDVNQIDQYFQFVKDMLSVISEPLIHSTYYVNQNLPTIQGLDKVMQIMYMIIAYTVGLHYPKSVKILLTTCYARADHK